jgi:hypothetical protein
MSFSSPESNAAGEFGRHARVLAPTGTPDLPNWWNRELRITYTLTAADELQLQVRCARMSHIHIAFDTPLLPWAAARATVVVNRFCANCALVQ